MASIGVSEGHQATACLPLRVEDRDLGRRGLQLLPAPGLRPVRAGVPHGRGRAVRPGPRPRAALHRRARGARRRRTRAGPHGLPGAGGPADGGAAVGGGAPAPARRPRRQGHRRLVRGAPRPRRRASSGSPSPTSTRRRSRSSRSSSGATRRTRTPPAAPSTSPAAGCRWSSWRTCPTSCSSRPRGTTTHLELIRAIGLRSAIVVPLLVRGRSLGALTLVHAESGEHFTEADLTFVGQLAATAAVALDNAALYEQQRMVARTLQTALLPSELPDVPGVECAGRYRPPRPGAHRRLRRRRPLRRPRGPRARAVGAHRRRRLRQGPAGRRAHLAHPAHRAGRGASRVRARGRRAAGQRRDAAEPGRLPRAVRDDGPRGPDRRPGRGDDHPRQRRAPAGDGPAARPADSGDDVEWLDVPGTLVGVYPDPELVEADVRLAPGDALLLYTDGVTEARGPDGFFGPDRLASLVASFADTSADTVADGVLDAVSGFQDGKLRDDVALLVIRAAP